MLKLASGYNKVLTGINPDVRAKRQIFVKSHIKLLSVFVGRNKGKIYNQKENEIGCVINGELSHLRLPFVFLGIRNSISNRQSLCNIFDFTYVTNESLQFNYNKVNLFPITLQIQ